jgi:transposase
VTEVGCLAHARRKFFDLHASSKSQIAGALQQIGPVYEIEREVKELSADQRQRIRQAQVKPLLDACTSGCCCSARRWPDGSATAKALDYSLKRWTALTRFVG